MYVYLHETNLGETSQSEPEKGHYKFNFIFLNIFSYIYWTKLLSMYIYK
jgi:hypothetical protein